MRHDHLITIAATPVLSEAETIRSQLRLCGITCVLGGILRARSRGNPELEIQIKVPAAAVAAARQLLDDSYTTPDAEDVSGSPAPV